MVHSTLSIASRLVVAFACVGVLGQEAHALGPGLDEVLGYRRERRIAQVRPFNHATVDGGGIHSWLHVSPKVMSWMAVIAGSALIASGAASSSDQYRKGAIITGSVLVPIGVWGVLDNRQEIPTLVAESTVRDYESVVRSLYQSSPDDRAAIRDLIRQYPKLHKRLVFSMSALRDPGSETAEESAFVEWYLSFEKPR